MNRMLRLELTCTPPSRERNRASPARGTDASVGGEIRLADLRGDTASVGHLEAVVAGPGADVGGARSGAGARPPATPPGGPARGADGRRKGVAQLAGVLGVEVDLVVLAVQGEGHGLLGGGAVDVVDEDDVHLLRHQATYFSGKSGPLQINAGNRRESLRPQQWKQNRLT